MCIYVCVCYVLKGDTLFPLLNGCVDEIPEILMGKEVQNWCCQSRFGNSLNLMGKKTCQNYGFHEFPVKVSLESIHWRGHRCDGRGCRTSGGWHGESGRAQDGRQCVGGGCFLVHGWHVWWLGILYCIMICDINVYEWYWYVYMYNDRIYIYIYNYIILYNVYTVYRGSYCFMLL